MSTLLLTYLLVMAATHAAGVLVSARDNKLLAVFINASLLSIALTLLLEGV